MYLKIDTSLYYYSVSPNPPRYAKIINVRPITAKLFKVGKLIEKYFEKIDIIKNTNKANKI